MNSRRTFIKNAGMAAAGALLFPSFAHAFAKVKPVGLQLYTLREVIGKDPKGVIEKVAKAGYKEVETYGYSAKGGYFGMDAKAFKSLLDNNGLKAPSGHFGLDSFLKDGNQDELKIAIEGANGLKMDFLTIPWMGESLRSSLDDYKKVSERLNQAAEICKKSGLKLAYHNHDFEFKKYDGKTGYEVMLQETDKNLVKFEMDLYWVVRSGNDPIAFFNKYPGRFPMWHVKDMDKANHSINTEVGTGTIDFKSFFKHAKQAGLKYAIVEQENFSKDPFVSIKQSIDYVNRELV
ncbi:sugar phosphate isomerase/epimerase [Pedobacter gandavensis]|uniref:sugar phosphate isomerase/epimerase family protein n=1 Tax=Pedobacter gandavensis TaxID=2679963 RepID=UPI0029303CA3|nr:sugar phosphate isomerase/epimerase [Pedobacter gandavensis]